MRVLASFFTRPTSSSGRFEYSPIESRCTISHRHKLSFLVPQSHIIQSLAVLDNLVGLIFDQHAQVIRGLAIFRIVCVHFLEDIF